MGSTRTSGRKGEENNLWRGDDVGYFGIHSWLYNHFGQANHCEFNPEHKAKRYEWANINHSHSRKRKDYIQLCPSCHRKFDKGQYFSKGHHYLEIISG